MGEMGHRSPHLAVRVVALLLLACGPALACVPAPAGRPSSTPPGPTPTPTPTASPTPAGPTPTLSFVRPTPTPQPTFLAHVVVAGDTLTSIARRYETTARSIAFWNRSAHPSLDPDSPAYAPDRIKVGWTLLLIPGKEVVEDDLPEPSGEPGPSGSPDSSSSPEAAVSAP
jgi:hypothetical protein